MEMDYRIENCLRYGYPERKEETGTLRCAVCFGAINEGEDYYEFYGEPVCRDCEYEYVLENFHKYAEF